MIFMVFLYLPWIKKFWDFCKSHGDLLRIFGVIIILSLSSIFYYLYINLFKNQSLLDPNNISRYFLLFTFFGFLLWCYFPWFKKAWNFLKTDAIVQYIFLALVPIFLIAYLGLFGQKHSILPPPEIESSSVSIAPPSSDSERYDTLRVYYDETIDRLTGLYGTLFTAIAVIAALLGLAGWRSIKELNKKLEDFKKFESKVDFIREKKELAEWAQEKFDQDDEKKILTKLSLSLSPEEEQKVKRIKENVLQEAHDDCWLKMVYVKQLLEDQNGDRERQFKQAETIYKSIRNKGLFNSHADGQAFLLHSMGLMYWEWYKERKSEARNNASFEFNRWFGNGCYLNMDNGGKERHTYLENSLSRYREALEVLNRKEKNADETLGNLAVVMIEKSKFKMHKNESNLNMAEEWLGKVRKGSFNTCWDRARINYYRNRLNGSNTFDKKIEEELLEAVDRINSSSDRNFFLEHLKLEMTEYRNGKKEGFPGEEIFENIKAELDKKRLC